jgi:ferric-dicitrate binding protein FerR (iron transport regulator)
MENLEITQHILYKYFSGQASEEEINAILFWLEKSPLNQDEFAKSKKLYIETTASLSNAKKIGRNAFKELERRIDSNEHRQAQKSKRFISQNFLKYAAIFILLIGFTVTAYIIGKSDRNIFGADELHIVEVPYGGKSTVTLPDGSTVHLNAGSRLTYNKNYGINSRELFIEGEGLFDIEKHKYPLKVHTSHINIEVLGTVFNVKSYKDESNIETTLLEGSIRVETPEEKSAESIFLKPNEMLIYNKTNSDFAINSKTESNSNELETERNISKNLLKKKYMINKNVDVYASVAWKDGKYIFNGETLEELATILARKFDINFSFENDEMKSLTYSGTLGDYPLEQVLEALSLTSPLVYKINEKHVYLTLDNDKLETYLKIMNN